MAPLSFLIPASGPCDPVDMHNVLAETARVFLRAARDGQSVPVDEILQTSSPRADSPPLLRLR